MWDLKRKYSQLNSDILFLRYEIEKVLVFVLVGEGQGQAGRRRVGKERGGASEDGEGSTLAGSSYWQKHLTKGRLSSTLMPSLIC